MVAVKIRRFADSRVVFLISVLWLLQLFGRPIEGYLFPVVEHFRISAVDVVPAEITTERGQEYINTLSISGVMDITRECERFIGFNIAAYDIDGNASDLDFKFRDNVRSDKTKRPMGFQSWGPWSIDVPDKQLVRAELFAVHDCHPFWFTKTKLAKLPLTWVPKQ